MFKGNLRNTLALFALTWLINAGALAQSKVDKDGFINLIDGQSLNGWSIIGNGSWVVGNGIVEGNKAMGYLITDQSYKNFIIRAEFWANEDANSGIFLRCQDRTKVTSDNAYEVNIFDKRPDQNYATGAIVDVAKVSLVPKAAGKWNTFEITANGSHFKVVMNGEVTVADGQDAKFSQGPIALQSAGGVVKFRKLQIKPL
ncbi:DUF1080 domain-containing protein [Polynucleobacter paneuropaeus]|nr:DUF1080 domain-containing protein [Polynucleobacter paneuropaeus]